MTPRARERTAAFAFFAASTALVAAFHWFPWHGPVRFALLMVLLAGLLAAPRLARSLLGRAGPGSTAPPTVESRGGGDTLGRIAVILVVAGVTAHVFEGARSVVETARTDRIALDQGENVYSALQLLFAGRDPYGPDALIDPIEYVHQVMTRANEGCLAFRRPPDAARLDAIWQGRELLDPARDRAFVIPDARCDEARRAFRTLGMKYGPTTLATYAPGVALFGRPGIFVVQIVMLLGICAVLARWGRELARGDRFIASGVFLPLLCSVHVYDLTMARSATDLPGLLYALLALYLFDRKRHTGAAVLLGLGVSTKLMPGLLYTPLLLAMSGRARLAFAAAALLPFVPFAVWHPAGLADNIFFYNLVRDTDRSALAHYLPAYDRNILLAGVATAALWLFWRTHSRGWRRLETFRALLVAHVGVLATAKIFHNNYLIWFLPILGLYLAASVAEAAPRDRVVDDLPSGA